MSAAVSREERLWQNYVEAVTAWRGGDRSTVSEMAVVEAFFAWAIVNCADPVAAHVETERLRHKLQRARAA